MLSSLLGSNSAALVWTRIGNDFSDLGPLISPPPWWDLMSPQTCFPLPILLPSAQREKKSPSVWVSQRLLICFDGIPSLLCFLSPTDWWRSSLSNMAVFEKFLHLTKASSRKKKKSFILPSSSPTPSLEPPYTLCVEALTPLTLKPTLLATGKASEMV